MPWGEKFFYLNLLTVNIICRSWWPCCCGCHYTPGLAGRVISTDPTLLHIFVQLREEAKLPRNSTPTHIHHIEYLLLASYSTMLQHWVEWNDHLLWTDGSALSNVGCWISLPQGCISDFSPTWCPPLSHFLQSYSPTSLSPACPCAWDYSSTAGGIFLFPSVEVLNVCWRFWSAHYSRLSTSLCIAVNPSDVLTIPPDCLQSANLLRVCSARGIYDNIK